MRIGMTVFRLGLCAAWAVLLFVSVHAVTAIGVGAAGGVFIGDFAHPWRAQFNADFSIYLVLAAAWMVFRARSWSLGRVWTVLAINLGGLFTLIYLLAISLQAKGDMRPVLLGRQAGPTLA
jgi:hypothetical protein